MPRSWWGKHQVFTVTALGALAAVAVLAVTPAGRWILRSTQTAPPSSLVTSQYTCDLSGYGYTGPPVGIAVSVNVTESAIAVAQTGFSQLFSYSGPRNFSTTAATLPASVASQLANLSQVSVAATIAVRGTPAASTIARVYGTTDDAYLPTGPLTQLQVVNAFDTAFYSTTGTAWLELPAASLLFTPYRDGKPLPTISCTVVAGGAVSASEVTVTDVTASTAASAAAGALASATAAASALASPGTPASAAGAAAGAPTSAPTYECASTYRVPTYRTPLPMTVTTSGVRRVGQLLTVTLSSPGTGLADPAPGQATKLTFLGKLPVTGAQDSEVKLRETTVNAGSPMFAVSGRLRLAKTGTDTISFPRHFTYTVYLQHTNASRAVFSCAFAGSAVTQSALTIQVAR